MKSLLWKDFITMKKYLRLMAIILAFYVVLFGFLVKDVTIASLMLTVIVTIVPTATFSYDELCKWDHFALSLPVRKKDIVLSKYVVTLICAGIGSALSLLLCAFAGKITQESLVQIYFCLFYALFCTAIIIPLLYRFGSVKARLLTIVVYMLPALLFSLLMEYSSVSISDHDFFAFTAASPFLLIAFLLFSYWLSCRIFSKKDR